MADNETIVAPVVEPELEENKENKENKENQGGEGKETAETELKLAEMKLDCPPSADIDKVTADLLQSRSDILGRVQNLKKDLQEWRGKLDSQVKTYRQEFQALRSTLKRQLDATTGLSELGPDSSPEKVNDVKENAS
ncbi:hypothetical protein AXG93_4448s1150 [Marchantia polymorpha subsp. ruderalis]|uniref:Uncharacterized protein n=1 Tax=Marchantia polymorpha subsp. ruderalis TaxID=1480154 RepID=A0A176VD13_MARPO|nr:hypothetical protein AXG93_4448s1150 [Marchantia polymorpha subsp. ruderalis]